MAIILDGTTGVSTPGVTDTGDLSVAGNTALTTPLPVTSGGTGATSLSGITVGTATNATTATNLAAGSAGTVPYQSASGTTAMLSAGSSGQVLTSSGAGAPTWSTPAAGGSWIYISSVTASSSATAVFTNIDATYDIYAISLTLIYPDTDNTAFRMRTSTDNGSTYDSGSVYGYAYAGYTSANAAADSGGGGVTSILLTQNIGNQNADETGVNGLIYLYKPSAAGSLQIGTNLTYVDASGNLHAQAGAANNRTAADVNAVQFYFTTGNIASGVFRLYGIKNS